MAKELLIEIYRIEEEDFFDEIKISHYSLDKINKICPPEDPFDIEYTDSLFLEENDFDNLKEYIVELRKFKYSDYTYGLITRRV
ncbi:MAG: hypothetical protein JHC39_11500 [Lentimicrobium sp.]|jgi:hypothetical protein|nr:hypothetical protein [Lentimicrobium sp.]